MWRMPTNCRLPEFTGLVGDKRGGGETSVTTGWHATLSNIAYCKSSEERDVRVSVRRGVNGLQIIACPSRRKPGRAAGLSAEIGS